MHSRSFFMMIYARTPKSKRKLGPKADREQYQNWLDSHKQKTTKTVSQKLSYSLSTPAGRETKYIPSLNTGNIAATKAEPKVYTGTKVLGIATLHKSNAVPVFNSQEAIDISSMRR
jgi:hypothetical protein